MLGKTTPSPLPLQEAADKEGRSLLEAGQEATQQLQAARPEPREERRRLLELPETQARAERAAEAEHTAPRSQGWLAPKALLRAAAEAADLPLTTAMPLALAAMAASDA